MKKIFTLLAAMVILIGNSIAKTQPVSELPSDAVTDIKVEQCGLSLIVSMQVHPAEFNKKANREIWITPTLVAEGHTQSLTPVVIAGRTRYYQHMRADRNENAYTILRSGATENFDYSVSVPFEPWMEFGTLNLICNLTGCCGDNLAMAMDYPVTEFDFRDKEIVAELVYVQPVAEEIKTRNVKGEAYIDFQVNSDRIIPGYRRNPEELAKIRATIDDVRNNKDVTITSLAIKGFASPEGPYATNERLAKGRTEALAEYVRSLYSFPKTTLRTSWVAEDWAGLAQRLKALNIDNKDAILAIVNDKSLGDDARDAMIKSKYPTEYAYLLENVYPALRHSDYTVTYVVRNYTELSEIAEVMATSPQLLSLGELYLYANSLEKSSPEFREVMEVAVRMFPTDPVANLNAATTAIDCGEYDKARAYLKKGPDTPQAAYTAGLLEVRTGNYEVAAPLLQRAADAGISEASVLLDQMRHWDWIK